MQIVARIGDMRRRTKVALATTFAALIVSGLVLSMIMFARQDDLVFRLLIALGKYRALTLNVSAVAPEMRQFARAARWERPPAGSPATSVRRDDAAFPKRLRRTRASAIRVHDDRVELEFGGTFLHYGIVVFREGEGHGLRRLGDGVWFYSEDGKASVF